MGVPMQVFTSARAALEGTRGTAITPTRIIYAEEFTLEHTVETIRPEEQRASYEGWNSAQPGPERSMVTMKGRASYEDLTWHCNHFYKALAAASSGSPPSAVWTFTPTNTSDDVKTHCLQLGDSAAIGTSPGISLAYGMGMTLNLHYEKNADGALTFEAKYLYAKALTQITAFTGALSDRVTTPISCNNTVVKVDTTTIGTTTDSAVIALDFTIDLQPVPLYTLDGTLAANSVQRPHHRGWVLEVTRQYNAATEFTAYQAKTVRKIRALTTNSTNILQQDFYGVWTDRKYADVGGIVTEVLTLEPVFDTGTSTSQSISLTNNVATIT
jgi:hypothetical protein